MSEAGKEKPKNLASAKKTYELLKKQKGQAKKQAEKKDEAEKNDEVEKTSSNAPSTSPAERKVTTPESGDGKDGQNDAQNEVPDVEGGSQRPSSPGPTAEPTHARQPSLSVQSKLRSNSFRRASPSNLPLLPSPNGKSGHLPALSPDSDSVNEIYRKQAFRLDELEKENKRLHKEAEMADGRWQRTEQELEELREDNGQLLELRSRAERADMLVEETSRLKSQVTALQRQITHLQSTGAKTRHVSSPSVAESGEMSLLQASLDSKTATISAMELEISNLRAQVTSTSNQTQISALEEKLDRAERAAGAAQRELIDSRRNLERASEKAVKEGSHRTSAETRLRALQREVDTATTAAAESAKRAEVLDKKLSALTTLHKEAESRRREGEAGRERLERECTELRRRVAGLEAENGRLREKAKTVVAGDGGDEGLDELEGDARTRLEGRVRDLEAELHALRHGVWKERRGLQEAGGSGSPTGGFDEVDLTGGGYRSAMGRRGSAKPAGGRPAGLAGVLSSGLSALTGVGAQNAAAAELETRDLMDGGFDDADDAAFDEDAFRREAEEEGKRRLDKVREVKRGLKSWDGWRLDIVDARMGGGGLGEIFDI